MGAHPIGIIVILVIAVLVFGGRGKISSIMGDMGKGISSFRKGLKDGSDATRDAADDALDVTPQVKEKVKDAAKKSKK